MRIMEEIKNVIMNILEKIKPFVDSNIFQYISDHDQIYPVPFNTDKPIITLTSKGGVWNKHHYYNKLEIYRVDIRDKPVNYSWIPEYSCCDYEHYEELKKIYQDDSGIILLYILHQQDVLYDNPLKVQDAIWDSSIYFVYF
ncbi:MAG: hypothetical protein QW124_06690 [Thermoplasmata archaeon]